MTTGESPLFKYMRLEHAKSLLSGGTIRIGTLYEYRNVETHGARIGDSREGSKGAILRVPRLEAASTNDLPQFAQKIVNVGPGRVTFVNCAFLQTQESPDFYIYSAASEFDEQAMREMEYDTCVRIDDPAKFFRAISRTLGKKASFEGLFPCTYVERDLPPDQQHDIHPALIKDPSYKSQREQRAVWRPRSPQPEPVIITCREARKYCTILEACALG